MSGAIDLAMATGHFLPFERWTINRLSSSDKSSAFYSMREDLTKSRGDRGWQLHAASVFWLLATGPAILVLTALAAISGLSWKLGLIAGGLIFLVGIARGLQSYAAGRTFQRDVGPGSSSSG